MSGPNRVSLDQLFTAGEEHGDPRQRRRWVPGALRDLLAAALLGGAIYAVLRVFSLVVPVVLLISGAYAVLLLRRAVRRVGPVPLPDTLAGSPWGRVDADDDRSHVDGVVRVVRRWEARFGWTERDHVRFGTAVLPRLAEVVEERLRHRHGVSLYAQPDQARVLVGPELWTFLNSPVRRSPTPQELAALVAEMEKI
jgi:hypothetical protein